MDLNLLNQICLWYAALGAPKARLTFADPVWSPGALYLWDHAEFEREGKTVSMTIGAILLTVAQPSGEVVYQGANEGLGDLIIAGLIPAIHAGQKFVAALPPAPPKPQPVDEVIGLPDSAHPGLYMPTDAARPSMPLLASLFTRSNPRVTNGRKFAVAVINPGTMFAVYDWAEV